MLPMVIYVLIVSVLLSAAALVAEYAAKQRAASRRWIWMTTIVASLLLPLIIPNVTIQVPDLIKPANTAKSIVLRDTTSVHMPAAVLDLGMPDLNVESDRRDTQFHRLWLAVSLLVLAALVFSGGLLYWRKRQWVRGHLCGTSLLIAPDVGPAVVGLLRPRIVVPAWLLQETAARQQFVLAHEQSHLDARDPQMLTIALCLLVVMPWNLPLWWQFHRLRRAIEVDCDARVLHGGSDVAAYCETLIQVGQNQSSYIGAVAAMSESGSFLEQRIKIMLLKPRKWARASALVLVCASLGMAAFAAQVTPPNAPGADNAQQVSVSPGILANYVGSYKFSPYTLMTVKLDGSQVITQLSGQIPVDIFPSNNTEFFAKVVNAQITFVQDAQGQTTALVLHQNGRDHTAPRIDAVAAEEINNALATRVSNQQPFPGSEKALKLLLSDPDSGAGMSPELAQARSEQKAKREKYMAKLGPVTSYEFLGVDAQGWDKYLVRREHGAEQVGFMLDDKGVIISAFFSTVVGALPKT